MFFVRIIKLPKASEFIFVSFGVALGMVMRSGAGAVA
jgi:hypothetical protein